VGLTCQPHGWPAVWHASRYLVIARFLTRALGYVARLPACRLEGENADAFRANFAGVDWVKVPQVYWEHSGQEVSARGQQ
jgi:hypothetical protein